MDFTTIFGTLAGVGVLTAGIGYGYAQFRTGANKAKDELVQTYKEQLEIEKEKTKQMLIERETLVQSHQNQLNKLTQDVGRLQGLNEANEKKIKEYQEILQGRNPEQIEFMSVVIQSVKDNQIFMKQTVDTLTEIKTYMGDLNKLHTERHPSTGLA
jgi:stress response protein YsnF